MFRHDMKNGFPLLTTKQMGLKNIAAELEFFIKGVTNKKFLEDRGCYIWSSGWKNPKSSNPNDLGPVYGWNWRRFGEIYDEDDDGVLEGADQLANLVNTLKTNPADRRMIVSAWNPNQLSRQALPPCHFVFGVNTIGNRLNLNWVMRSVDCGLGLPYNIASYSLLNLLLAREANLPPGELTCTMFDCHIYCNHIDQLREQLTRQPYPLPTVKITGDKSIFDWEYTDFELSNYKHHPKITMDVAV